MKKIKYVIFFLIFATNLFASLNSKNVVSSFDFSMFPEKYHDKSISSTDVMFGYDFKFLPVTITPYGGVKTWMVTTIDSGRPFRDSYYLGTNIKFNKIKVSGDHYCEHPVYADEDEYNDFNLYEVEDENRMYHRATQLTKFTVAVEQSYKKINFLIGTGMDSTMETGFMKCDLNYNYKKRKVMIRPYIKCIVWSGNDIRAKGIPRAVIKTGLNIEYNKFISIDAQYYKSSRDTYNNESNHEYDEYPLTSESIVFMVKAKV